MTSSDRKGENCLCSFIPLCNTHDEAKRADWCAFPVQSVNQQKNDRRSALNKLRFHLALVVLIETVTFFLFVTVSGETKVSVRQIFSWVVVFNATICLRISYLPRGLFGTML